MPNKIDDEVRRLNVVASVSLIKRIDEWRRREPDIPNISESIRRLLELGLENTKKTGKHK